MSTRQIGEILNELKNADTDDEKTRILLHNRHRGILELVLVNYNLWPFVNIPKSEPPYTPSTVPYPYNDARLFTTWKQYYIFRNTRTNQMVAEMRFIQMLESLHADEAKILVDCHLRRYDFGVSVEILNKVFGINIPLPVVRVEPVEEVVIHAIEAPKETTESEKPAEQPKEEEPKPATKVRRTRKKTT